MNFSQITADLISLSKLTNRKIFKRWQFQHEIIKSGSSIPTYKTSYATHNTEIFIITAVTKCYLRCVIFYSSGLIWTHLTTENMFLFSQLMAFDYIAAAF